jgi:hypothetical protein
MRGEFNTSADELEIGGVACLQVSAGRSVRGAKNSLFDSVYLLRAECIHVDVGQLGSGLDHRIDKEPAIKEETSAAPELVSAGKQPFHLLWGDT